MCSQLTCWSRSALKAADVLGKRSLFSTVSLLYNLLEPSDEEEIVGLEVYEDLELGRQKGSLRDLESITIP